MADLQGRSLWVGVPLITLPLMRDAERLLGAGSEVLVWENWHSSGVSDYDFSGLMRYRGIRRAITWGVFLWSCVRYKRFHFFCDRTLLYSGKRFSPNWNELKILKALRKQIFFWCYGADVRTQKITKALGEPNCCSECPFPGEACVCDDTDGREKYEEIRSLATAIFSMGDMQEYTPGSRNDLFFWPVDLEVDGGMKYRPHFPAADAAGPVRIVHAPNHRHFKGTRYLLEAVDLLKREGLDLELRLVEKVPNAQALEIYRTADIIFDQCLIGFHGYFANEAMAMGKPVVCFIRKPEYLLDPEMCPIVNCRPETVADVLRGLAKDRKRLHELGVRGRAYIEKYYTLAAFAGRLKRAYQDLGIQS